MGSLSHRSRARSLVLESLVSLLESEQNRVLARHSGLGLFIVWLLQFYPREVDLLALCFRCTALLPRCTWLTVRVERRTRTRLRGRQRPAGN